MDRTPRTYRKVKKGLSCEHFWDCRHWAIAVGYTVELRLFYVSLGPLHIGVSWQGDVESHGKVDKQAPIQPTARRV